MSSALHVDLVTPEKQYLSTDALIVAAPGMLGDFAALAGHAPLVSLLRPGVIEVTPLDGSEMIKLFVAHGFVEVNETSCTILAEEVIALKDMTADTLQREKDAIQFDLDHAANDKERDRLQAKLELCTIKMHAIK